MGEWKRAGQGASTDRTWNPEVEKTVQGVYVEKKSVTKKDGKLSTIYVLREKDGKNLAVWTTAVLENRFSEIPLGYEVMIEYLGKVQSKTSGHTVKSFNVDYKPADEMGESIKSEDDNDDIPF